jgi:hypothetical protein
MIFSFCLLTMHFRTLKFLRLNGYFHGFKVKAKQVRDSKIEKPFYSMFFLFMFKSALSKFLSSKQNVSKS